MTIAKEFDLTDATENLGVRMLRQAAERTAYLVGDGTSTAMALAQAIFADGVRNVVAEAMEKIGIDGVITVEESKSIETVLDVVEGMQFDRGFLSHYFITNQDKWRRCLKTA